MLRSDSIEKESHDSRKKDLFWVTVYDNDYNTFEEVIQIIQSTIFCSFELAEHMTYEIHNRGTCKVLIAPYSKAHRAADMIGSIGMRVTVDQVE